jgi:hypothetical protein
VIPLLRVNRHIRKISSDQAPRSFSLAGFFTSIPRSYTANTALGDTPVVFRDKKGEEVPYEPGADFVRAAGYVTAEEANKAYKAWCKKRSVRLQSARTVSAATWKALGTSVEKTTKCGRTRRTERNDSP